MAKRPRNITIEKDLGAKHILATAKKFKKKPHIRVGILENSGLHKDEDGNNTELTVCNIAVFNEFGTEGKGGKRRTPARPFMRESGKLLMPIMEELTKKLIEGMALGKLTLNHALGIMGEKSVAVIKKVIVDFDTPPNAEYTIWRKARKTGRKKLWAAQDRDWNKGGNSYGALLAQYDNPLIDTGQMKNSVSYIKETNGK